MYLLDLLHASKDRCLCLAFSCRLNTLHCIRIVLYVFIERSDERKKAQEAKMRPLRPRNEMLTKMERTLEQRRAERQRLEAELRFGLVCDIDLVVTSLYADLIICQPVVSVAYLSDYLLFRSLFYRYSMSVDYPETFCTNLWLHYPLQTFHQMSVFSSKPIISKHGNITLACRHW